MQAVADLSAIFAEDSNAMSQGTNSALPISFGFEEPPQLPGALFDSLESLVRMRGVMPTAKTMCKCTALYSTTWHMAYARLRSPGLLRYLCPQTRCKREPSLNCARADGLAAADFAVTAADAQSPTVARFAPALRVRQTAIDSLVSSVVDYAHRQIVVEHLLDYSQVRCISDLQRIDMCPMYCAPGA